MGARDPAPLSLGLLWGLQPAPACPLPTDRPPFLPLPCPGGRRVWAPAPRHLLTHPCSALHLAFQSGGVREKGLAVKAHAQCLSEGPPGWLPTKPPSFPSPLCKYLASAWKVCVSRPPRRPFPKLCLPCPEPPAPAGQSPEGPEESPPRCLAAVQGFPAGCCVRVLSHTRCPAGELSPLCAVAPPQKGLAASQTLLPPLAREGPQCGATTRPQVGAAWGGVPTGGHSCSKWKQMEFSRMKQEPQRRL